MGINADEVHAQLGAEGWRQVLSSLGVADNFLVNRHGPCPACGGKDRFRFDNRKGRGDFFCSGCGAGDGFALVMRIFQLKFSDAKARILASIGIVESTERKVVEPPPHETAAPTSRVYSLLRESCQVCDCDPARNYLASRYLWPLPSGHALRAHPSVAYFHYGQCMGRYPALIAEVRDSSGELVTAHVTYLDRDGCKLSGFEPRKLLSGLVGREGCAVQLMKAQETLGIAEGIETAFSASRIHRVPVWAAVNASLLAKFIPPPNIKCLIIFADHDLAGVEAANKLMLRLQGRLKLDVRTPREGDWNDVLRERVA